MESCITIMMVASTLLVHQGIDFEEITKLKQTLLVHCRTASGSVVEWTIW